jgi:apolipoprotein N-acyltransferase
MTRVALLSRPWRLVAALFAAVALATLPTYVLALVLLPPVPPLVMIRSFALGTALPAAVAWAIVRLFAGTAGVRDGVVQLRRDDLAVDVPCAAVAAVRPWWIPLPMPGLAIALRAPGRLPVGIATTRPGELLDALAARDLDVTGARRHPAVVHATTRPRRGWMRAILKFAGFGALPAGLLFYTHQHIAYGGTFGQYYLEGAGPYLRTLAEYWATTVVLLVSYASFWRAPAELVVWTVGALRAEWAPAARRVAEAVCALAYYAGVPLFLALRYLA